MKQLSVIDFFCGAGGFSEGFRQMGFKIEKGYDNWKPAIETYNHNFGTDSKVKNVLDFYSSIEDIEALPNSEIILGSPPCVSFSSSNKSGKADKSLGLDLTKSFLRIVAVKKHQQESNLKAWFMENVVNSKKYLQAEYTFEELELTDWSISKNLNPKDVAVKILDNSAIINAADYGSLQARKRFIAGEIINEQKLIIPSPTYKDPKKKGYLPNHKTIGEMKASFPSPFSKESNIDIPDPQFDLTLKQDKVTDHFYDTGIFRTDAKFSKHWKTNHPYMGKMSFPENENKPSRTITATRIANSRESIIYKSEFEREGDGEYRVPTIREAAILMGFPISYQFYGSEYTKWRLVGNAVCSTVSRMLASSVLESLEREIPKELVIKDAVNTKGIQNLNSFDLKDFEKQPRKNKGAKCRWHTFKDGNLTVTLSNYRIGEDEKSRNRWYTSIQYGSGEGFPIQQIQDGSYRQIEALLREFDFGEQFVQIINNGFSEKISSTKDLQFLFEHQKSIDGRKDPTELVEELRQIIEQLGIPSKQYKQEVRVFKNKNNIPIKQLFALYGINKISSTANKKKDVSYTIK
jgi:DNA (cytosine-5)-methyltransferase 1